MGPMRGSDAERMMAEIEAFLRTGEAPPAAPEPGPEAPVGPFRAFPPGDHPAGSDPLLEARRARAQRSSRWPWMSRLSRGSRYGRLSRLNPIRHGLPLGRPGGVVLMGREWRLRRRIRRRGGLPPEPPKWTVLRAVIVVAVLGLLLALPSLLPGRSSGGSGGADHASAAPAGPGYSFLRVNRSGTPVRWNPCSPIYYVTNLSAAPAYASAELRSAVAQISRATGILFVDRGSTTAFPSGGGDISAGGQAGPVVIAWADSAQTSKIGFPAGATGADALARTEPIAAVNQTTGHGVYVTGTVLIGAGADQLPQGFAPGGLGVLLLHEFGHLVGLGNVATPGQVMNANVLKTPTAKLGPGDLAGLTRLGTASGCESVPSGSTFEPTL